MEKLRAVVEKKLCLACGGCISVCPQDAILLITNKAVINKEKCKSCEICIKTCPIGAINWERNS